MKIFLVILIFPLVINAQQERFFKHFNFGLNYSFGWHFSEFLDTEQQVVEDIQLIVPGELGFPVYFDPDYFASSFQFWSVYKVLNFAGVGLNYEFHHTSQSSRDYYSHGRQIFMLGNGLGPALVFSWHFSKGFQIHTNVLGGFSAGKLNRFALLKEENRRQKQLPGGDQFSDIDDAFEGMSSEIYLEQYYFVTSVNFAYRVKKLSLGIGPAYRFAKAKVEGNESSAYPDKSNIHEVAININLML